MSFSKRNLKSYKDDDSSQSKKNSKKNISNSISKSVFNINETADKLRIDQNPKIIDMTNHNKSN